MTNSLASLDFTPEPPRCECTLCPPHWGSGCPHPAQYRTKAHAFGACKTPGLTPDGGHVQLLCHTCAAVRKSGMDSLLDQSRAYHQAAGAFLHCLGCQHPLAGLDQTMWEVRALADG